MTKLEEYTEKAAASLAAVDTAKTEQDRAFHRRAHAIWRKLIVGIDEAEARAAIKVAPRIERVRPAPRAATSRSATLPGWG